MPPSINSQARTAAGMLVLAALALTLPGCTLAPSPVHGTSSQTGQGILPSVHVHGLAVDGNTGQVLLATHEGLFDVRKQRATKIGPTNDVMGFTSGQDQGIYYASGHPGQGSDLPNPVGLLRSGDGGKTWEKLSRQGESDFHALTVAKSGIVAFDGKLRASPDGKSWKSIDAAFVPTVLAGHPASDTILATTRGGLQRSTDGGTTWTRRGAISGEVQAVATVKGADGKPWIWAATSEGIVVSTDGGATFRDSAAA
jgi:hypothetical protein